MDDLRHRLGIYRLTYLSFLLGGGVILAALILRWPGRYEADVFALSSSVGIFAATMFFGVAQLLKRQNQRLERLEEQVGRLQEDHAQSAPSSGHTPVEQRDTP